MVAAHVGADLGRAAELAPHDDRAILVEPALVQVVQQGAQALVEDRKIFGLAGEDRAVGDAVPVPLAVIERHHAGAGFDQSAGQEQALRNARRAVLVDEDLGIARAVTRRHAGIFLRQIERLRQPRRSQQAHRLVGEMVHALHHPREIGLAAKLIEAAHERPAVGKPVETHAAKHHVVARRSHRAERGMRRTQKSRARLVVGGMRARIAEAHKGGRRGVGRPLAAGRPPSRTAASPRTASASWDDAR